MKARFSLTPLFVAAFLAVSVGVRAADAPAKEKPAEKEKAAAKDKPAADVKSAMEQFNAKRDAMLKERQALLDQLKNATAEQRKAILEQMQAQQKDMAEAQKALGRQIREELRKLGQSKPPGGKS